MTKILSQPGILTRKIDETRKDVQRLHPLLELLNSDTAQDATSLIEYLITLIEAQADLLIQILEIQERVDQRQERLEKMFDLNAA